MSDDGLQIPYQSLSGEVLRAIIEEFVLQEGTEYGEQECPLDKKVEQVRKQLETGRAVILFDAESETCSIARN